MKLGLIVACAVILLPFLAITIHVKWILGITFTMDYFKLEMAAGS
jgi:hypothetical protein